MTTALDTWKAEEAQLRAAMAQGVGEGVATREQVSKKTGLEIMQSILRGDFPTPPIANTLDFCMIQIEEGHAVFQGTPGPKHLNPLGTIHGGWISTLLDSALGCSVHTKMPVGRGYTTAELSVNIVRALSPKIERVRAIANVLHCGRQLATAEAKLVGPDGTLYAHATTTCLVFELK